MRPPAVILLCVAVAAAPLAGCKGWGRDGEDEPFVLRPMRPADDDGPRMYQVQIVRLMHRIRPDAPLEDTWRLLGTAGIPHEKRALWRANDLRMGEGGQLAAERFRELVRETPDRTARFSRRVVPENRDFVVESGPARTDLDVVWTGAGGRLSGRRFARARPRFRFVCRPAPDRARAVCIALVPEIAYGKQRFHYRRTENAPPPRVERETCTVPELAVEVRLDPGRMLVLSGERSSDMSLGAAFFFERRGADLWKQTLLVSARPVTPDAEADAEEAESDDADASQPPRRHPKLP